MMESLGFLEFGPFQVDLSQRLLFRGGEVVPTAPKVFETLLVLVEHHGRVVSKDDLLKRVWPDTFVEEGSLARNVSILRKLLGENAEDQTFIETIPKRGYRFVAPVTAGPRFPFDATSSVPSPTGASARRFRRGTAVGLVLATIAAIATGLTVWRLVSGRPTTAERAGSILDLELTSVPNNESAVIFFAISGDGKFMTYVNQPRADEGPSVRVRQLSNDADREVVAPATVPGSTGAAMPAMVWGVSVPPDDPYIYFVRNRVPYPLILSLYRVPFNAGSSTTPTQIVDDVRTPVGWSPDGQKMAFIRSVLAQSDSLVVADADGTHEKVVRTRTRPAAFETIATSTYSAPAWSPDGKTIAVLGYDTKNDERVPEIVFVNEADGSEGTVIRPAGPAADLDWLDNDELLLTSSETPTGPSQLWRVPYPYGPPSKLTNDFSNYLEFSLTADRDTMLVLRSAGFASIWVGDGDGTSLKELLPPSPEIAVRSSSDLAWAGDRLLYTSTQKGYPSIMSVVPGREARPEMLVPNAYAPSATSDGKTIVFQSTEDAPRTGLWKSDGDGRNRVRILTGPVGNPLVTPDDRFVVFRSTRSGGMDSPWLVSIDGKEPTEIVHVPAVSPPRVSPDGKQLLVTMSVSGTNQRRTFICDFPACGSRRDAPQSGEWMPDGKRIVVVNTQDLSNLWAQSIDGGEPQMITHFVEAMGISGPRWTRDGRRLAVSRVGSTDEVVAVKSLKRLKR